MKDFGGILPVYFCSSNSRGAHAHTQQHCRAAVGTMPSRREREDPAQGLLGGLKRESGCEETANPATATTKVVFILNVNPGKQRAVDSDDDDNDDDEHALQPLESNSHEPCAAKLK